MAVHPTAMIDPDVTLGRGTAVWDNVHIRHSTRIGDECIIGEKTYIAYGVRIGDRVKITGFTYICTGVRIERGVMIGAGTVFTNDRFPRATTPDLRELRSSGPGQHTFPTLVREGATIGANCTIGCNLTIGRFAMVGMGSVVTHDVPDFALAVGNPARQTGHVCACGARLVPATRVTSDQVREERECTVCAARYRLSGSSLVELAAIR